MPKILIENISKTYISDFKRKRKTAVDNISLAIDQGEVFGLIGRNGAGKSTIIKMIMGFICPDSGQILIAEKIPSDPDSRQKIGYLPENPYFYDNLSAMELLRFSTQASGLDKKRSNQRIEILLNQVGLYGERKQKLRTFSKGMIQRIGICFALVHDPEVIILDEPMSGLDPFGRRMVIDLIESLKKRGKTILFSSHILNDVEQICDRVGIMDRGTLKRIYTKDEILESADVVNNMEEIFFKTIGRDE